MAHQDHWANVIYDLRQELHGLRRKEASLQAQAARARLLKAQQLHWQRERQSLRTRLARYEDPDAPVPRAAD